MFGSIGRLRCASAAAAGLACVALAVAATVTAAAAQGAANDPALAAGRSFLDRYLQPDGRTVRRDQGGDTVAAGQAQAMLIALALGDARRFSAAWRWTRSHLVRRDGLPASHWRGGRITNAASAADADLDTARALVLAGGRFHAGAYRAAGGRVARAILARETRVIHGRLVLLGGTWVRPGRPASINPSYNAPRTYEQLAAVTHDRRFRALEQSATQIAAQLMTPAPTLPPDWAVVQADGIAHPTSVPGRRSTTPRYSFDAARLPIRFAESCDPASRAAAAMPWRFFATQAPDTIGTAYSLDGAPLVPAQTVVTLMGAAASAQAAGQPAARDALLARAETVNTTFPTYYGAAWLALGRISLTTGLLGGCTA
jgi:endoglucanase